MADRILVAFHVLARRPAAFLQPLREAGYELTTNELGRRLSEDETIDHLRGCRAVIAADEPYTERVFAACPDLEVVARFGVGFDTVDVSAATRHSVVVAMAFGSNHEAVADYTLAHMLALTMRVLPHHRMVAEGGWGGGFHPGMWNTTVGIVGLGRIGKGVARRCFGFEARLLATDPVHDDAFAERYGISYLPLDDLLARSDIVAVTCSLSETTRGLVGERELALMKPDAGMVCTARGGIIDEAALVGALRDGRLAGAGLDVFAAEPPRQSPLLHLGNVVLSPHVAGVSAEGERMMGERTVANVLAVLDGRDPGEGMLLNPEVLQRS